MEFLQFQVDFHLFSKMEDYCLSTAGVPTGAWWGICALLCMVTTSYTAGRGHITIGFSLVKCDVILKIVHTSLPTEI